MRPDVISFDAGERKRWCADAGVTEHTLARRAFRRGGRVPRADPIPTGVSCRVARCVTEKRAQAGVPAALEKPWAPAPDRCSGTRPPRGLVAGEAGAAGWCAIRWRRGRRQALDEERGASDSDHARVVHATIAIRERASARRPQLCVCSRRQSSVVRVAGAPARGTRERGTLSISGRPRWRPRLPREHRSRSSNARDKLIQIEGLEQAIVDQRLGL